MSEESTAEGSSSEEQPGGEGTGTFLGVPYDWRRPTRARFKERWWNTGDRRLLTPKVYGWGYDLNLAELTRRMRLRG